MDVSFLYRGYFAWVAFRHGLFPSLSVRLQHSAEEVEVDLGLGREREKKVSGEKKSSVNKATTAGTSKACTGARDEHLM